MLQPKSGLTASLQALLTIERLEDDLRRAHAQLEEVCHSKFITKMQSHNLLRHGPRFKRSHRSLL